MDAVELVGARPRWSNVRLFASCEDDRRVDVQADVPEHAEVGAQVQDVPGPRVLEVADQRSSAGRSSSCSRLMKALSARAARTPSG